MYTHAKTDSQNLFVDLDRVCMFFANQRGCCTASREEHAPGDRHRNHFCVGDNYDNCPHYLSYLLRRSHPKARYSKHEEFTDK